MFSICEVPDNTCFLEFEEWSSREPEGLSLHEIWVRFHGAPSRPLNDFYGVLRAGSLDDVPETPAAAGAWMVPTSWGLLQHHPLPLHLQ